MKVLMNATAGVMLTLSLSMILGCAGASGQFGDKATGLMTAILGGSGDIKDMHDPRFKQAFTRRLNETYQSQKTISTHDQLVQMAAQRCRHRADGKFVYTQDEYRLETVVKNGKATQYLKASLGNTVGFYYPLANEKFNGWGEEYKGREKTRVFFKEGRVVKWEHYLADGTFYAKGDIS